MKSQFFMASYSASEFILIFINNEASQFFIYQNQMKAKNLAIWTTIVVTILGIILNFLFETMPDDFKTLIADLAAKIGLPKTVFWLLITSIIIAVTLFIIWWQVQNGTTRENNKHLKRQVTQNGEKSIYIENHEGDIHIN